MDFSMNSAKYTLSNRSDSDEDPESLRPMDRSDSVVNSESLHLINNMTRSSTSNVIAKEELGLERPISIHANMGSSTNSPGLNSSMIFGDAFQSHGIIIPNTSAPYDVDHHHSRINEPGVRGPLHSNTNSDALNGADCISAFGPTYFTHRDSPNHLSDTEDFTVMCDDDEGLAPTHVSPLTSHVNLKRRLSADTPSPPLLSSTFQSPYPSTASYSGSTIPPGDDSSTLLAMLNGPFATIFKSRYDELLNSLTQLQASFDSLQRSNSTLQSDSAILACNLTDATAEIARLRDLTDVSARRESDLQARLQLAQVAVHDAQANASATTKVYMEYKERSRAKKRLYLEAKTVSDARYAPRWRPIKLLWTCTGRRNSKPCVLNVAS